MTGGGDTSVTKELKELNLKIAELIISIAPPKTEPATEIASPPPVDVDEAIHSHVTPPLAIDAVAVNYLEYDSRKTFDEYYNKLFHAFKNVNGENRYRLSKTKFDIRVKDGGNVVFKTRRTASSARNLYLELYSCHYLCGEWLIKRNNGDFGGIQYETTPSPPTYV